MALTITNAGSNTNVTANHLSLAVANVTASVGDMLVVLIAASNDADAVDTITSVTDGSNTYTRRLTTIYDPGAAGAGALHSIFTSVLTSALSAATVTVDFNTDTDQSAAIIYRAQPGAGETPTVRSTGPGATGNASSYSITATSVASGDTIFGSAAIETDDAVTGDSDTTNGSWSTQFLALADGGADAACMTIAGQWKTTTGAGDQTYNPTTVTGRDAAWNWITIYPASSAKTIAIGGASYSFSPQAVTLHKGYIASIAATSYAFSPQAITFTKGQKLAIDATSYSFSPQAVSLLHGWKAAIDGASYAFTAQAVTLNKGQRLAVDATSYAFSPQAVTLLHGWKAAIGAASYSFTAQDVSLEHGWEVALDPASYSFSAQDVSLEHGWKASIEGTSYSFSPADITFTLAAGAPAAPAQSTHGFGWHKGASGRVTEADVDIVRRAFQRAKRRKLAAEQRIATEAADANRAAKQLALAQKKEAEAYARLLAEYGQAMAEAYNQQLLAEWQAREEAGLARDLAALNARKQLAEEEIMMLMLLS